MGLVIDTHAHLTADAFDNDLDEVLDTALEAGVSRVICVSEDLNEAEAAVELARRRPHQVAAAAGLFPTNLDLDACDAVIGFTRAHRQELVAIGEVGLDYWKVKDEPEREIQREILDRFAKLSTELDLPLNVHSRSAGHHTIAFLLERGCTKVQMHAFDGKASRTLPALEAGWYFSIPPSIVRSPQKQKLVKRVPLENLLVETDSPVLGPDRDTRNVPENVGHSVRAIAEIKGLPVEAVYEAVFANTVALYGDSLLGLKEHP